MNPRSCSPRWRCFRRFDSERPSQAPLVDEFIDYAHHELGRDDGRALKRLRLVESAGAPREILCVEFRGRIVETAIAAVKINHAIRRAELRRRMREAADHQGVP